MCVLSTAGHSEDGRTGQQRGRITGFHGHGPLGLLFSGTRLHMSDSVGKPLLRRIDAPETTWKPLGVQNAFSTEMMPIWEDGSPG